MGKEEVLVRPCQCHNHSRSCRNSSSNQYCSVTDSSIARNNNIDCYDFLLLQWPPLALPGQERLLLRTTTLMAHSCLLALLTLQMTPQNNQHTLTLLTLQHWHPSV